MKSLAGRQTIHQTVQVLRFTAHVARRQRALRRAVRNMPNPAPWDWAAPRLMPLLSGPQFDEPDLPIVRMTSELGPAIEFGLDLGGVFVTVDRHVAERWECSADQLLERGLANVRDRATRITADQVVGGVMSGHTVRVLRDKPAWASSILLDLPTVQRLFGTHDQILAAPTTSCVISVPIDTPSRVAADIVVDFEGPLTSLFLDPFVMEDGALHWAGSLSDDELDNASVDGC
ncbi:MAG TPA: hypothetical protein VM427_07380 [Patescibacteria group bacterium]|nr:hypothetical protein [Patescibacteria group bacterium]